MISRREIHTKDADCKLDDDGYCVGCGEFGLGPPCPVCGAVIYHKADCAAPASARRAPSGKEGGSDV